MRSLIVCICTCVLAAALGAQSYTVSSGTLASYADLANPTQGTPYENSYLPITPGNGFSFTYFGQTYTTFDVCSNGYLCMGGGMTQVDRTANHNRAPGNYIAALWQPYSCSSIYGAYNGYEWDSTNGVLTIEWKNCPHFITNPGTTGVRMQIVLHTNTGVIEFHYETPVGLTGQTSTFTNTVSIGNGTTAATREIINGSDSGFVATDGSVTTYPAGRYIRFTPVGYTPPLNITTTSPLPDGTDGVAYQQQFNATGGTGSYTWSDTAAMPLPTGWSINTAGLLSAPAGSVAAGTYNFEIMVEDQASPPDSDTVQFQVTVVGAGTPLSITTTSPLPDGTEGVAYQQQFNASGGVGAHTWSDTGAMPLPTGWSIDTAGLLTAPAGSVAAGTYNFEIMVEDQASPPDSDTVQFQVTVNASGTPLAITTTSLPNGTEGVAYSTQLNATGGTPPYAWSATGLPAGWALSITGELTAPPASVLPGSFNFTAEVDDGTSQDASILSVTITASGTGGTTGGGGGGGGGGCVAASTGAWLWLLLPLLLAGARRARQPECTL